MTNQDIQLRAGAFTRESKMNRVVLPDGKVITLFEEPLLGFADPEDLLFGRLQQPEAIGPHFRLPSQWLPNARTVISFFLPFSEEVRTANSQARTVPSQAWLYGRIEGQQMVSALAKELCAALAEAGFSAVVPCLSPEFWTVSEPENEGELSFTSNWSERHVAYICGLGTFGLSRGLITEKGMAGRFGSLITSWKCTPSTRPYSGLYDNCVHCGACVRRCPGGAISMETGKSHSVCLNYQKTIQDQCLPRYGCGLCQTGVPCEHRNPGCFDRR